MSEKHVVTQSQLGPLKLALAQEAASLVSHSNDTLSNAHGFEIVQGPAQDNYSNRLVEYRNSNNDIVGNYQLKITLGDLTYYVPAELDPSVSAQTQLANISTDLDGLLDPGENNWVTDYAASLTTDAQLVMSNLLLPHTRKGYWEAHGGLKAYAQVTTDTKGYTIGEQVVELITGNQKVLLPASKRMGGPPQTPRILTNPQAATSYAGEGSGQPPFGMKASAEGTNPMQFQWQYAFSRTAAPDQWFDIKADGGTIQSQISPFNMWPDTNPLYSPAGTGSVTTLGMHAGGSEHGAVDAFYIRCKFFTVFDSIEYANYTAVAAVSMEDKTGKYMCTLALKEGVVSQSDYDCDCRWVFKNVNKTAIEGYRLWALPLSKCVSRTNSTLLKDWAMSGTLSWIQHVNYLAGNSFTPNWKGRLMFHFGTPVCYAIGCINRLWRALKLPKFSFHKTN